MYARVTSFKIDPSRLGELPAHIDKLRPVAKALPGIVDIYVAWRADGHGAITAVYRSKADAESALGRMQALWGALAGLLHSAPRTDAYDTVEHVAG